MYQYYFYVSSALPYLYFDQPPMISFEEFILLVELNFSKKDQKVIWQIRELFDILNLQKMLYGIETSKFGNYNLKQLQDLFHLEQLPEYLFEFFTSYQKEEEQRKHFPKLLSQFFLEKIGKNGFIKKYYRLLRDYTFLQTALRAFKTNRPLEQEFQFEDLKEESVAFLLAQKGLKEIKPMEGFEKLPSIFEAHFEDPKTLYIENNRFLFEKLEEMKTSHFGKMYLFVYCAQLILLERLYQERNAPEFLNFLFR